LPVIGRRRVVGQVAYIDVSNQHGGVSIPIGDIDSVAWAARRYPF
jgi:hypothetical protein